MKKILPKIVFFALIIALILMFKHYEFGEYLTLEYIKQNQVQFAGYYQEHQFEMLGIFFGIYVSVAALSLPGAVILTLSAGALFGFLTGFLLVSFASSIGATLAFLSSRYLFRNYIQRKFKKYIDPINRGIEKDGSFYLFTLRLIPLFPFFVINLVMGITQIKALKFYLFSQLGMVAGTIVYVNAGLQLASLDSFSGILSPAVIGSFVLLGIFPLLAKKFIKILQDNKVSKNSRNQKK